MIIPKLTKEEAIKLIAQFNVPEKVVLLGVRGYFKKTMGDPVKNDRSIYDDAMFIIAPELFKSYNANTDPSKYQKGISSLKPGLHYYKKGKHGISKPGGGYPALRPATPNEGLPVVRDGVGESIGIAINIHKGGKIYTNSAGCQTIYPDQWNDFIDTVYSQMDKNKQNKIPYILINQ
jgi:lysozyme